MNPDPSAKGTYKSSPLRRSSGVRGRPAIHGRLSSTRGLEQFAMLDAVVTLRKIVSSARRGDFRPCTCRWEVAEMSRVYTTLNVYDRLAFSRNNLDCARACGCEASRRARGEAPHGEHGTKGQSIPPWLYTCRYANSTQSRGYPLTLWNFGSSVPTCDFSAPRQCAWKEVTLVRRKRAYIAA